MDVGRGERERERASPDGLFDGGEGGWMERRFAIELMSRGGQRGGASPDSSLAEIGGRKGVEADKELCCLLGGGQTKICGE